MGRSPPPSPPRQPHRPRPEIAARLALERLPGGRLSPEVLAEYYARERRYWPLTSAYKDAFCMCVRNEETFLTCGRTEETLPSAFNLLAALRVLMKAEGVGRPRVFHFDFGWLYAGLSSKNKQKINELNVAAGHTPDSDVDSDPPMLMLEDKNADSSMLEDKNADSLEEGPAEAATEPAGAQASTDGVEGNAARRSRSRYRHSRSRSRRSRY